jgi:hypothetical protein
MSTLAPLPSLLLHPIERHRVQQIERRRQENTQNFAWRVQDLMARIGLAQTDFSTGGGRIIHIPQVLSVVAGPPVGMIVRTLPGQVPADFVKHATKIAYNLDISEVQVVPLGPALIRLDLLPGPFNPPHTVRDVSPVTAVAHVQGAVTRHTAHNNSPVVAISHTPGHLDVFWIGLDGDVETTWTDRTIDDGRWHTPVPIAPDNAADPQAGLSVIAQRAGWLDVFWVGPDGGIGTTWAHADVDDNNWHAPVSIAPPRSAIAVSPPVRRP